MYPSHPHENEKNSPGQGVLPNLVTPPVSSAPGYPPSATQYYRPPNTSTSLRVHQVRAYTEQWSTGLCHCCDDPANCIITCFCPCITFGQISEIVNRGSKGCARSGALYVLLGFACLPCLYSCFYRSKLRGQYDLEEAPCVDCLVHFCCEFCALCQEYRELKNRGFDMGIGWDANMDRQSRGVIEAPIIERGMRR
ncbi:hypothetical protein GIB67_010810 [Kingdonia uniflora]|uniref:POS2 n=1 Tax=Kingdonia uniflora TaxID=39325 RepID=A0A7J7L956_9MAGN|nr:hypothetical protein GIB67_010810 [Kingdonia uniflora]